MTKILLKIWTYIRYFFVVLFRDFYFLFKTKLPLGFRLWFPFCKYYSLILFFLTRKKEIYYFGNKFVFDNWTTSCTLQMYPNEVRYKILENIDSEVKHVLDIGGNIGQFSVTAKKFLPHSEICIFEPNKVPFSLLEKNVKNLKNIYLYPYGVGSDGVHEFFYVNGMTATGSAVKGNADFSPIRKGQKMDLIKDSVEFVSDIKAVTGRGDFDLIKIDVEGYECDVLKYIKNVKARYLFIEVSGARFKDFSHSDLFSIVEKKFGSFDIVYQSGVTLGLKHFDVLLKIK